MGNTAELSAQLNELRAKRDRLNRELRAGIMAVQAQLDVAEKREALNLAEAAAKARQAQAEAVLSEEA